MPVNYNQLNTNAPAQVARAMSQMNPLGYYNQGQNQAMAQQHARQTFDMNNLNMQHKQQMMPGKLAKQQQELSTGAIDEQTKKLDLVQKNNEALYGVDDQNLLQATLQSTAQIGPLVGMDQQQLQDAQQKTQQLFQQGGPQALRQKIAQSITTLKEHRAQLNTEINQKIAQGNLDKIKAPTLTTDQKNYQAEQNDSAFAEWRDKEDKGKAPTPTNLKKLIMEREELVKGGAPEDDPMVKAYDAKIDGSDITAIEFSPDEITTLGIKFAMTDKMPSLGRGKAAARARMQVAKAAAKYVLGPEAKGTTPINAAMNLVSMTTDTKAIQGSLNFLDKQISAMGSFVTNLNEQVSRVSEIAGDIKTFDARIMNLPYRALKMKVAGNPTFAKYDMYLTEIEGEIGKLATGSSASIAELSTSAQEKWAAIHDKNLSVKDMMELLQETAHAANLRYSSVEKEIKKTRSRMVNREEVPLAGQESQQLPNANEQGWTLHTDAGGNKAYVSPDGKQFQEVQ